MTDADFRHAFQSHKDIVYRFAYRMTGSNATAEDIAQDCFVTLWRKPGAFDPSRGTLRSFLLGIVRNLVLKRWRSERPLELLDEAMEDGSPAGLPFDVAGQERDDAVRNAIMTLPPLQREALILAEYEELSLAEIGAATASELAAVKSRLHRARQNLRRVLEPLFANRR